MFQLSNDAIILIAGGRYGLRRVGDCMLCALPRTELDDAEYENFTDALQADILSRGRFQFVIHYSPTHAPNAHQRRLQLEPRFAPLLACMNEVERGITISDSAMTRGAITALKWQRVGPKQHDIVSVAHYRKGIAWVVGAEQAGRVEDALSGLLAATKHASLPRGDIRSRSEAY